MDPILRNFGCFMFDLQEEKIISSQTGVFRVSCLDCMNRTNTFLMGLALRTMELQLEIVGVESLDMVS